MRLGQLARKLALRPSQIVDYLATKQIFPDEGSNARLSDEVTERVVLHFAPERLNEIMTVEDKNPAQESTPVPVEEEPVINKIEDAVVTDETTPSSIFETTSTEAKTEVEVIKAPKVELSGLKVLGKIELPEPKKKAPPVAESIEETEVLEEKISVTEKKPAKPEAQVRSQQRRGPAQRPARNPIALQREQKAREEEENRKEKAERDKEKRTQYYLQRVKTGQPTKAAKMISEPTESFSLKEEKPTPKTWFGKFLRWLNT